MKYYTQVNEQEYVIELDRGDVITVNGETYPIDFQQLEIAGMASLLLNHRSLEAVVEEREDIWDVLIQGELYSVRVQDERAYRLAQARGTLIDSGDSEVKAPMPGIIITVPVEPGDKINKGDKVVILESMKMENELKASRDGIVTRVNVAAGDNVEKGQALVVIDEVEEGD